MQQAQDGHGEAQEGPGGTTQEPTEVELLQAILQAIQQGKQLQPPVNITSSSAGHMPIGMGGSSLAPTPTGHMPISMGGSSLAPTPTGHMPIGMGGSSLAPTPTGGVLGDLLPAGTLAVETCVEVLTKTLYNLYGIFDTHNPLLYKTSTVNGYKQGTVSKQGSASVKRILKMAEYVARHKPEEDSIAWLFRCTSKDLVTMLLDTPEFFEVDKPDTVMSNYEKCLQTLKTMGRMMSPDTAANGSMHKLITFPSGHAMFVDVCNPCQEFVACRTQLRLKFLELHSNWASKPKERSFRRPRAHPATWQTLVMMVVFYQYKLTEELHKVDKANKNEKRRMVTLVELMWVWQVLLHLGPRASEAVRLQWRHMYVSMIMPVGKEADSGEAWLAALDDSSIQTCVVEVPLVAFAQSPDIWLELLLVPGIEIGYKTWHAKKGRSEPEEGYTEAEHLRPFLMKPLARPMAGLDLATSYLVTFITQALLCPTKMVTAALDDEIIISEQALKAKHAGPYTYEQQKKQAKSTASQLRTKGSNIQTVQVPVDDSGSDAASKKTASKKTKKRKHASTEPQYRFSHALVEAYNALVGGKLVPFGPLLFVLTLYTARYAAEAEFKRAAHFVSSTDAGRDLTGLRKKHAGHSTKSTVGENTYVTHFFNAHPGQKLSHLSQIRWAWVYLQTVEGIPTEVGLMNPTRLKGGGAPCHDAMHRFMRQLPVDKLNRLFADVMRAPGGQHMGRPGEPSNLSGVVQHIVAASETQYSSLQACFQGMLKGFFNTDGWRMCPPKREDLAVDNPVMTGQHTEQLLMKLMDHHGGEGFRLPPVADDLRVTLVSSILLELGDLDGVKARIARAEAKTRAGSGVAGEGDPASAEGDASDVGGEPTDTRESLAEVEAFLNTHQVDPALDPEPGDEQEEEEEEKEEEAVITIGHEEIVLALSPVAPRRPYCHAPPAGCTLPKHMKSVVFLQWVGAGVLSIWGLPQRIYMLQETKQFKAYRLEEKGTVLKDGRKVSAICIGNSEGGKTGLIYLRKVPEDPVGRTLESMFESLDVASVIKMYMAKTGAAASESTVKRPRRAGSVQLDAAEEAAQPVDLPSASASGVSMPSASASTIHRPRAPAARKQRKIYSETDTEEEDEEEDDAIAGDEEKDEAEEEEEVEEEDEEEEEEAEIFSITVPAHAKRRRGGQPEQQSKHSHSAAGGKEAAPPIAHSANRRRGAKPDKQSANPHCGGEAAGAHDSNHCFKCGAEFSSFNELMKGVPCQDCGEYVHKYGCDTAAAAAERDGGRRRIQYRYIGRCAQRCR